MISGLGLEAQSTPPARGGLFAKHSRPVTEPPARRAPQAPVGLKPTALSGVLILSERTGSGFPLVPRGEHASAVWGKSQRKAKGSKRERDFLSSE